MAFALAGLVTSCSDPPPPLLTCPAVYYPAIAVRLTDVATRQGICTAIVTATNGDETVTLTSLSPDSRDCAFETSPRAGTYLVRVRADGYRDADDRSVDVEYDRCHSPISRELLEFALVRE